MARLSDREIVQLIGSTGSAFFGRFDELRDVQRQAIPPILEGHNVLVASATASGKTEAVMAPMVHRCRASQSSLSPRIQLLVVAPTRALVNDLYVRIEGPLGRLSVNLGRQTSDHSGKSRRPTVLITTPESLDSMLVRGGEYVDGKLAGHLLDNVSAVFIDEAHLFDGTARGDQLIWLLERLRRIRRHAVRGTVADESSLQLCAASATITDPEGLASRLFGPSAVALKVPGKRGIEVFGGSSDGAWFPLEPTATASELRDKLLAPQGTEAMSAVTDRLWEAFSQDGPQRMRKALVFVPTRNLCDRLTSYLRQTLSRRREMMVLGHHGSLDRNARENAESMFLQARDAVLVATTTLEVGIDIGDVDLVALVGAPPGTRSMLQRIGRAGRRIGTTRALVIPRSPVERAAFASMLVAARDGKLEPETYARRWSVFVQQVASLIAQTRERGRSRSNLVSIAEAVWPEREGATANEILDQLVDAGFVAERHGRLFLGDAWADAFTERGMHANLDSSGAGWPVVDANTGQVIAHVRSPPASGEGIPLAGQVWKATVSSGEILLTPSSGGKIGEGFRYATRGAPIGLESAIHLRRGLGLDDYAAPIIKIADNDIWMHFGGSAYQALLMQLFPRLSPLAGFPGIALCGRPSADEVRSVADREGTLERALAAISTSVEPTLGLGPYHRHLPDACRQRVVRAHMKISQLKGWLATRDVSELDTNNKAWQAAVELFIPMP